MPKDCDAKIRPMRPANEYEVTCERTDTHEQHRGTIRDYAYPGSETVVQWMDSDRRTFRGDFVPCPASTDAMPLCILPAKHHGNHAP